MVRDPAAIPAPPPKWRCTRCGEETDMAVLPCAPREPGDWWNAEWPILGGNGQFHWCIGKEDRLEMGTAERITAPRDKE